MKEYHARFQIIKKEGELVTGMYIFCYFFKKFNLFFIYVFNSLFLLMSAKGKQWKNQKKQKKAPKEEKIEPEIDEDNVDENEEKLELKEHPVVGVISRRVRALSKKLKRVDELGTEKKKLLPNQVTLLEEAPGFRRAIEELNIVKEVVVNQEVEKEKEQKTNLGALVTALILPTYLSDRKDVRLPLLLKNNEELSESDVAVLSQIRERVMPSTTTDRINESVSSSLDFVSKLVQGSEEQSGIEGRTFNELRAKLLSISQNSSSASEASAPPTSKKNQKKYNSQKKGNSQQQKEQKKADSKKKNADAKEVKEAPNQEVKKETVPEQRTEAASVPQPAANSEPPKTETTTSSPTARSDKPGNQGERGQGGRGRGAAPTNPNTFNYKPNRS